MDFGAGWPFGQRNHVGEYRIVGITGDHDRPRDDSLGVVRLVEECPGQTGVIDLRGITGMSISNSAR